MRRLSLLRRWAVWSAAVLLCGSMASGAAAQTLPALENAGGATVSYSGSTMTINLNGANRIIDVTSFNLGTSGSPMDTINVLGTQSVLFRVTGSTFSDIYGYIQAPDASVFISNPNGLVFEGTSSTNIGGTFQVTTATFDAAQRTAFLNGTLTDVTALSPAPGSAINIMEGNGTIVAAGDIVFDASFGVLEDHTIVSTGGTVMFNGQVVPEPGAWAMMIGGFALMGGMIRMRRRKRALAIA